MAFDIWHECSGETNITSINQTAWRIVEIQEKTSMRKLVDSLEEQKILEELIEKSKPAMNAHIATQLHPLLYTPFRYSPLKHGSRFGKKTEPSLWYGSLSPRTTMAEKAYYQLAFINASNSDFGMVISPMTIFSVQLKIAKGIKLNEPPFLKYKNEISSPINYSVSQHLGEKMRANNIDGFNFISARDKNAGINVGLFNTNAFAHSQPDKQSFQTWQCHTTKMSVEFMQVGSLIDQTHIFPIQTFLVDEVLPFPAA